MYKKVSIIIPSYKRNASIVNRAVQSVLNQTYPNIEIILIDDNALEEHADFRLQLEQLAESLKNSERFFYIPNSQNFGGAESRNIGIKACSGEIVTFLDDDDEYLPEKIEKQYNYMLLNELDMSFTDLAVYDEDNKLIEYRDHHGISSFDNISLLKYHIVTQITGTPTFMINKELLLEIKGFNNVASGHEFHLMEKIINSGCKIGYLSECYIKVYRTNLECISNGINKIPGENERYKYKKQYFYILSGAEKRYVRSRHYAVLAVANKRRKSYFTALFNLVCAFFCAPITAFKIAFSRHKLIKEKSNANI